jgi:3',5'-cyclic AMP phosphodiesterase CpdA
MLHFLRTTLLLLLTLSAALAQTADTFFFVQLADTQFGFYTGDKEFDQETAAFEFSVANINRLKPAFVVICGDLVNKPGDPAQIAEFQRIAGKIDKSIKLYNASGNHDVGNDPTPESIAAYNKIFGPTYYSFRHADFYGIVLESNVIKAPAKVPAELEKQEAWLKEELAKAKASGAKQIAIFQHHPYFLERPDEPDSYNNIPFERRTKYMTMFKEAGVTHIFAGHLHKNAIAKDGPIEIVANAPVGRPLGTDGSGLRIVTVRPTGITHRYYSFAELPNKVSTAPERGAR